MTIQDWGAIGEIVGAIGVVVSLFYLATQIRHSSQAARNSTSQAILGASAHSNSLFAGNIAEVIGKLESGAELNPEEEFRFSSFLMAVFAQHWQVHYQHTQGMLEPAIFETYERRTLAILQRPSTAPWWQQNSFRFSEEFQSYINELYSRSG